MITDTCQRLNLPICDTSTGDSLILTLIILQRFFIDFSHGSENRVKLLLISVLVLLGYLDWKLQEQNILLMLKKKVWLAFKYFPQQVNQKIILNLKVTHVIIKMTHFQLTLPDKCFSKETLMLDRKLARRDTSAEIVSAQNVFQRFFLSNHWHFPLFSYHLCKTFCCFMLVIFVLLVKVSFFKQLLKPQCM